MANRGNDDRVKQLEIELGQLRERIGQGRTGHGHLDSNPSSNNVDNRSFSSITNSALGNLSRLHSSFSAPRFNPMSRAQTHSRAGRSKSQGRRYDVALVVLDYVPSAPVEMDFSHHHTLGTGQLTLFSTFDEKRCEREILSTIRMFEGLENYGGRFSFVKRVGRKSIIKPTLSALHKFDAKAINSFKGSGNLYVRLTSPSGIDPNPTTLDEDMPEGEEYQDVEYSDIEDNTNEVAYVGTTVRVPGPMSSSELGMQISNSTPEVPREPCQQNLSLPDFLKKEKLLKSTESVIKNYGLHNFGSTDAVSVVIALLQYIPSIMIALSENTRIGSALLDLMAVRGCRDNAIVDNAIKCFLCSIGKEYGEQLDVLEVLEKTLLTIKAASEELCKAVESSFMGEWLKNVKCKEEEVSLEYSHGPIVYVVQSSQEKDACKILRSSHAYKRCTSVQQEIVEKFENIGSQPGTEEFFESIFCEFLPELFLLGIKRNNDIGIKDRTILEIPKTIPFGILKDPEVDTEVSGQGYGLKALIIHSEIRSHSSIAVKNGEDIDSWILYNDGKTTTFKMTEFVLFMVNWDPLEATHFV
ncbi:uncharacterized protein LOC116290481 isoform X2 [Actinia tenebrosa]|uniref:Uncharacterized protein LOC116290481 isoform X2 n=1 Tax=Actinia tenebrosa TaxID=6105 RepID=A0A6P8HL90_ACTTE|nr:uncharacterized protein LOC116290481 isoform X2 [Actinia tenebrosa]